MSTGPAFDEKRSFQRMRVDAEITFNMPDGNGEYAGQCINLSHSGILFDTESTITEGQTLQVNIDTKSEKFKPVNATVCVVRVETADNDQNRIAGKILEFR